MILVDTSAWVEYDRATRSPVDVRLTELIRTSSPVAVTEPVIMEVLAGAKDERRERELRRLLERFDLLRFDSGVDFDGAMRIYRTCRRAGITPRGLVDCMIAAVAARLGVPVLARDGDYVQIATVVALDLDPATPGSESR